MKTTLLVFAFFSSLLSFAQSGLPKKAQLIVEEGMLLYRSEMASWNGTDLYLKSNPHTDNIGGYFSYPEGDVTRCIFVNREAIPSAIATITFDASFSLENAEMDLTKRPLSKHELNLFTLRKLAIQEAQSNDIFKTYQRTNLNFIPIINGKSKKVYVLTGPQDLGVVLFGNDYLIEFNKKNKITKVNSLHQNLIPVHYDEESREQGTTAIHSHTSSTGDYITATDICTIMLYSKYAGWDTHHVISEKYMNSWDCKTNSLTIIPRKVLDSIEEDQKERHQE